MTEHRIRLLATDFDGTVFRYGNESHMYAAFAERVSSLRAGGARWLVCSGRNLRNLRSASRRMLRQHIKPDYLLVRHWLIMTELGGIWVPNIPLTLTALSLRGEEARRLRTLIARIVRELHEAVHRCRIVYVERLHLRIQCRHDEDVETVMRIIGEYGTTSQFVTVLRCGREVEFRYIPFSKAVAVTAIRNRLGVTADEVLAIGDGRSDVGMMVASVAAMAGCPSNARRDTIQYVIDRGGHIAGRESLGGTIDVIDAFLNNTVSPVPPAGWQPPSESLGIPETNVPTTPRHNEKRVEICILVGTAIAGLVVLASFGIIPYGQEMMKPLFYVVNKLLDLLL